MGPLKALLELEPCLPSFSMNMLNLLVAGLRACMAFCSDRRIAANDRTDQIVRCTLRTNAVSVVCKRDFTVMNCTAGRANSNTIDYHNPDFLSLVPSMIVETQTLITIVMQLRLTMNTEAKILHTQSLHETVFLSPSVRHLECF